MSISKCLKVRVTLVVILRILYSLSKNLYFLFGSQPSANFADIKKYGYGQITEKGDDETCAKVNKTSSRFTKFGHDGSQYFLIFELNEQ